MKKLSTFAFLICCLFSNSQNKEKTSLDSIQDLDQVFINTKVIFGSKYVAKNQSGSAYYLSSKDIEKFNYTDINRLLRSVPGVSLYEEDGFGLRPNISMRGTSPERSAKISIMEDGILIAPAPYSAPAAYYFPSIARMSAVEILKGSSQIQYGPFTTGGAINMVSTQIPNAFTGSLRSSFGSFNTHQTHVRLGDNKSQFGYSVEYLKNDSNGFKNLLDNKNTGFDKNDFVGKVQLRSSDDAKYKQALTLKFQYSDEVSNETYLGLTVSDFNQNPFDRYSASSFDKMTNKHQQFMATHEFEFSNFLKITTSGYYNKFSRNWYKLNDVTINGDKVKISKILEDPITYNTYLNIIRGDVDSEDDALLVKANNRDYLSKGVQTKLDFHWAKGELFHDLEIGLRYHYDEEDRFQWKDGYNMSNGTMNLTSNGAPGSDANRISSAKAFAGSILYKLKYNNWTITPGIRYEDISLERENFGTADPDRNGSDLSTRKNNVSVFIPGIGMHYKFNNFTSIFAGIHKGFSPPGNQNGQKAEESINYEIGTRFSHKGLRSEIVAFYNDYSNLLGSDLAATGGTGSLDQFNAGEVSVKGIELLLNYDLMSQNSKFAMPISFGYTLTDAVFQNNFGSDEDLWGEVESGDKLPYIAKHQFNASISLEHRDFELHLNGRQNGAFRTEAGSNTITSSNGVTSNFIVDFSGKYHLSNKLSFTGTVLNLFDTTYAVSKVPAGLRPGHPFGIYGGIEFRF